MNLRERLRQLVKAVEALDPAACDDAQAGEWDAAKWRVFNAAVRLVKDGDEMRPGEDIIERYFGFEPRRPKP